jgi:peptidoglycan/LPS O-acetylase OafA/YrhL
LFFVLNIGIANKSLLGPPANLLPLWSISLEEQFYLFWGAFLTLVRNQKIRYLTLAALLIMTVCVRAYLQRSCDTYLCFYENTLSRLDPLIFGAAVAFLADQMPSVVAAVKRHGWAIFATSILLLFAAKQQNPTPFIKGFFNPFCFTLVDFGWSVFLLSLLGFAPLIKLFSGKYIVQFGRLTYSMYVFHLFVLQALERFVYHPFAVGDSCLWRPIVNWCVGVPLTYLIAWLTWNLFEKRFYSLKFRFSQVPSGHT